MRVFVAVMRALDWRRVEIIGLEIDHQHPLGHADLDRGKADARGVIHRLEHVFDKLLELGAELMRFNRSRDGFQPRVRHFKDFADSHRRTI